MSIVLLYTQPVFKSRIRGIDDVKRNASKAIAVLKAVTAL